MTLVPLLDALVQLLAAVLLAIGVAAVRGLADWLKLAADDRVRGYLRDAMENAVAHGLATADRADQDRAEVVSHAADYVRDRVPDTLARFGIDQPSLRTMLAARLVARSARP